MATSPTSPADQKKQGCGIFELYSNLRRKGFWIRRSSSTGAVVAKSTPGDDKILSSRRRKGGGSDETSFLAEAPPVLADPPPKLEEKSAYKSPLKSHQQKIIFSKNPTSQLLVSQPYKPRQPSNSNSPANCPKSNEITPKNPISRQLSTTLSFSWLAGDSKTANSGATLVRASSKVSVLGYLGNLRQPVTPNYPENVQTKTTNREANPKKKNDNGNRRQERHKGGEDPVLCRALSRRMDPEELKEAGNEEYKKGRFAEALGFYDRAIALDPERASYRSNKSAALIGLGRLVEALAECREAIRIEPSYSRAHHRLANLYLRLGEPEKSLNHYNHARSEANANDISKAHALQAHLTKCVEARKTRDWHTMLKETNFAISAGADAAPQVFASQAEALLKLHRPEEADAALTMTPVLEVDASTKLYGTVGNAYLLVIRAQVDMASGRFESAVSSAQQAARLDSSNKEVVMVARKARAVASARSAGNELFTTSLFKEACMAYGEGLEHDPVNAVLLCNRAACRSKLGQLEKAIDDCTAALNVRPGYNKARLRRADCNAKLERWEASIQDYEVLVRESPGDVEIGKALLNAQVQLKKRQGQHVKDLNFGTGVVLVLSTDHFRELITVSGMVVVLFCTKSSELTSPFLEQLRMGYPTLTFLKVGIDDLPSLANSENVNSVPVFKIYKNGSRVKEIPGNNQELLESSLKYYNT